MFFAKIIFWFSLVVLFYSYIGYGLVLWIYLKIDASFSKRKIAQPLPEGFEPEVTLLVATYNEELIIKEKIANTFLIDYPKHKLKVIFVADGSTDDTAKIIKQYPGINLYYQPERKGKSAAINRAMPFVTSPITIFCDANTQLNKECIKEIVKHYIDPRVGAVAGEKKVEDHSPTQNTAGAGEGLYWKYESTLKDLDAQFYSVVGAAGELFSIRTSLFDPVQNDVLLDDFLISMRICQRGYRVMYEPKAFATEAPSFSMRDEQKRKVRIAAGAFQAMYMLKDLFNIFKYGKLSFQYISHRVLRWLVCPILLPILFLSNLFILLYAEEALFQASFLIQCIFYLLSVAGWMLMNKNIKVKVLFVPYYFLFMNISMYLGFLKFANKEQSVLWEKANRKM